MGQLVDWFKAPPVEPGIELSRSKYRDSLIVQPSGRFLEFLCVGGPSLSTKVKSVLQDEGDVSADTRGNDAYRCF
jgi:hypothetical protein